MTRILVVDDDVPAAETIRDALLLDNPEWLVEVAENETRALEIVQKLHGEDDPVDLLITDLKMAEDQSGMTLLRNVRAVDPSIMGILYTGREDLLDRNAALELGAFDVVERNLRGGNSLKEIRVKAKYAADAKKWQRDVLSLGRYFDARVFERLRREPTLLEMRERLVSIMFCDIRGFTRLCDVLKAQPALVTGFLKEYCELAARTIFDHDGVLDKFIGDGVMALFGVLDAPTDDGEADAINAVRSALALRQAFEGLYRRWQPVWAREVPDNIEIGLGCGIHTCRSLVGNTGTRLRDQFTAFGDGVNMAARLESRAKTGQILLTQSTMHRVKVRIHTTEAGAIEDIKNRPGKFQLYAAEHELAVAAGR